MEDEYKKRFHNRELPHDDFDAEGLWEDIAGELDEGAAAKGFPWTYLGGAVLLLLVAAVGFMLLRNDATVKNMGDGAVFFENKSTEVATEATATLQENSGSKTNAEKEKSAVGADASDVVEKSDLKDKIVEKNDLATAKKGSTKADEENAFANDTREVKSTANVDKNVADIASQVIENQAINSLSENKNPAPLPTKTDKKNDAPVFKNETDITAEKQNKNGADFVKNAGEKEEASPLLFTAFTLLQNEDKTALDSFVIEFSPLIKKDKKTKEIAFFGDLYGGANTLLTDFQLQTDSLTDAIENKSESGLIGNTVGVNIGATYQGWQLRTGVALHTFNTRFDFGQTTTRNVLQSQVLKTVFIDSTGAVQNQVFGDTTVTVTDTRRIEHYNQYHLLEIPLEIGRYRTQGKFMYGVNVGVGFNFLLNQSGRTLDLNGEILDFNQNTTPVLCKDFGISARIGGQFGYRLTDKIWLTAEPRAAWQSGLLFEENVRVRAVSFGVNAGVKMVF